MQRFHTPTHYLIGLATIFPFNTDRFEGIGALAQHGARGHDHVIVSLRKLTNHSTKLDSFSSLGQNPIKAQDAPP